MKLIEVQSTKEFANTFLNDIFFKMAVNRVLDAAPSFDLVHCKECEHQGRCEVESLLIHGANGNNPYCSYGERKEDGQA